MKTAIVIPCYNEAQRLSVNKIISFINQYKDVVIYLVNDGSKDETLDILNQLSQQNPDSIKVIDLKTNRGKAEAVRLGTEAAFASGKHTYIMFLDADFSTSLEECIRFIEYADANKEVKVVCGCRIKRMGAEIHRSVKRHYIGRVFASFTFAVLPLPMYDTQCGAKLFRVEVVNDIFSRPFISKWLFDIELLLRLSASIGYERALKEIYELPLLSWKEVGGSKIGFNSLIGIPIELFKVYTNYKPQVKIVNQGRKSFESKNSLSN